MAPSPFLTSSSPLRLRLPAALTAAATSAAFVVSRGALGFFWTAASVPRKALVGIQGGVHPSLDGSPPFLHSDRSVALRRLPLAKDQVRRRSLSSSSSGHRAALDGEFDERQPESSERERERHWKRYRLQGATSEGNVAGVRLVTGSGHELHTDLPRRMGGTDVAPEPVELLVGAWVGCTQATALYVGRHLEPNRVRISKLEFDIQAVRDNRGALHLPLSEEPPVPSRLLRIWGTIRVHVVDSAGTTPLAPDTLRALQEHTERRCPVAATLVASGCALDVNWVDAASVCE